MSNVTVTEKGPAGFDVITDKARHAVAVSCMTFVSPGALQRVAASTTSAAHPASLPDDEQ